MVITGIVHVDVEVATKELGRGFVEERVQQFSLDFSTLDGTKSLRVFGLEVRGKQLEFGAVKQAFEQYGAFSRDLIIAFACAELELFQFVELELADYPQSAVGAQGKPGVIDRAILVGEAGQKNPGHDVAAFAAEGFLKDDDVVIGTVQALGDGLGRLVIFIEQADIGQHVDVPAQDSQF